MRHTRQILRAFLGRPKLPRYKHQTEGRNLIVFERGAVWKGSLKHGEIAVSQLGLIALTRVKREQVDQERVVPKDGYDVVEVIYSIRKYCPMMTLPIVRTACRAGQVG